MSLATATTTTRTSQSMCNRSTLSNTHYLPSGYLSFDRDIEGLTPKESGHAAGVCEGANALHQGAIESLGHTIERRGIVDGESASHTCGLKMLVKGSGEVLSAVVRVQDVDGGAELLRECP